MGSTHPHRPPIPVLDVEFDGTGVPVVRAETEERQGKIDSQPAHTREAKLGCVFTQTTVDEDGYPVRDDAATTYTGASKTAEDLYGGFIVKLGSGVGVGRTRRW